MSNNMGYKMALEAAGAKIIDYEQFGSYQGDWYAKVWYNGIEQYVCGSYGSCSMCDAFEIEFGYTEQHELDNGEYHDIYTLSETCERCKEAQLKVIAFGKKYLEDCYTYEKCKEDISRNLEWDMEAQKMLDWLEKVKDKHECT